MKKVKVYEAVYHCQCGSCDIETVYVPIARQRNKYGDIHYYIDSSVVRRHIEIVPPPKGAIRYIY